MKDIPKKNTNKQVKLTIGRLALAAGVGIPTIRYYQKRGLLALPRRPSYGSVRVYEESVLARLVQIRDAQKLGYTLSEIGELLSHLDGRSCDAIKQLISKKYGQLTEKLHQLKAAQQRLADLNGACEGNCVGDCPLIANLTGSMQVG